MKLARPALVVYLVALAATRLAQRLEKGAGVNARLLRGEALKLSQLEYIQAARALGVSQPVTSPTYTVGNRYAANRVCVAHLDLYRSHGLTVEEWADLEPYFEGTIVFVEWLTLVTDKLASLVIGLWSLLILAILARQTRNVRILSLGTLITVRTDPVRVAEEYATADVISRGRLEIGFVKSGGSEMASGNANPIGIVDRFWEAIDLVIKTLSHREGPFSWEGKYFTHRHVNIWPGPWQQPHPPLWAATGDPTTSAELGRRGLVNVMVFRSIEETLRALDEVVLHPPIQRFLSRWEPGDPAVYLGALWAH